MCETNESGGLRIYETNMPLVPAGVLMRLRKRKGNRMNFVTRNI